MQASLPRFPSTDDDEEPGASSGAGGAAPADLLQTELLMQGEFMRNELLAADPAGQIALADARLLRGLSLDSSRALLRVESGSESSRHADSSSGPRTTLLLEDSNPSPCKHLPTPEPLSPTDRSRAITVDAGYLRKVGGYDYEPYSPIRDAHGLLKKYNPFTQFRATTKLLRRIFGKSLPAPFVCNHQQPRSRDSDDLISDAENYNVSDYLTCVSCELKYCISYLGFITEFDQWELLLKVIQGVAQEKPRMYMSEMVAHTRVLLSCPSSIPWVLVKEHVEALLNICHVKFPAAQSVFLDVIQDTLANVDGYVPPSGMRSILIKWWLLTTGEGNPRGICRRLLQFYAQDGELDCLRAILLCDDFFPVWLSEVRALFDKYMTSKDYAVTTTLALRRLLGFHRYVFLNDWSSYALSIDDMKILIALSVVPFHLDGSVDTGLVGGMPTHQGMGKRRAANAAIALQDAYRSWLDFVGTVVAENVTQKLRLRPVEDPEASEAALYIHQVFRVLFAAELPQYRDPSPPESPPSPQLKSISVICKRVIDALDPSIVDALELVFNKSFRQETRRRDSSDKMGVGFIQDNSKRQLCAIIEYQSQLLQQQASFIRVLMPESSPGRCAELPVHAAPRDVPRVTNSIKNDSTVSAETSPTAIRSVYPSRQVHLPQTSDSPWKETAKSLDANERPQSAWNRHLSPKMSLMLPHGNEYVELKPRFTERPMVGLVNLGKTCFANAVLQVLFLTEQFVIALLRCKDSDLSVASSPMNQPPLHSPSSRSSVNLPIWHKMTSTRPSNENRHRQQALGCGASQRGSFPPNLMPLSAGKQFDDDQNAGFISPRSEHHSLDDENVWNATSGADKLASPTKTTGGVAALAAAMSAAAANGEQQLLQRSRDDRQKDEQTRRMQAKAPPWLAFLTELRKLYLQIHTSGSDQLPADPSSFYHTLVDQRRFPLNFEHDCSEFLGFLLDGLGGLNNPFIRSVFGGLNMVSFKCGKCGTEKKGTEQNIMYFITDALAICSCFGAQSTCRLDDFVDVFKDVECDKCHHKTQFTRHTRMLSPPAHAIINIISTVTWSEGKLTKRQTSAKAHVCDTIQLAQARYALYAMILHKGPTAESGHYYAIGKLGDKIYVMNDSTVNLLSNQTTLGDYAALVTATPYILMYQRVHPPINNEAQLVLFSSNTSHVQKQ